MATVRYTISKRVQSGRAEVRLRFTAGRGVDFQAMTRIFVPVQYWNTQTGALSFSTRFVTAETAELQALRLKLSELQKAVLDAYMQDPSRAIRVEWLRDTIEHYHHPDGLGESIPLSELCPRYAKAVGLAPATAAIYDVIARMLVRYGEAVRVLYTDDVTSDDLEHLQHFMEREATTDKAGKAKIIERGRNTIATRYKKLRAACSWAVRKRIMLHNPFDGFSIPSEVYGSVVALTIEERDQIAAAENLSPAMAIQRDVFVFQCHIGCRVSDLVQLTHDSVTADGFIEYVAHKTMHASQQQRKIRVPIDETVRTIIDRYADADPVKLLPFIDPIKYNVDIKKILKQAGITRQVLVYDSTHDRHEYKAICDIAASHLARRTFGYNMFKATMSDRITASMTGHAPDSRAFNRYVDIDDDMKLAAMHKQNGTSPANPDEIPT